MRRKRKPGDEGDTENNNSHEPSTTSSSPSAEQVLQRHIRDLQASETSSQAAIERATALLERYRRISRRFQETAVGREPSTATAASNHNDIDERICSSSSNQDETDADLLKEEDAALEEDEEEAYSWAISCISSIGSRSNDHYRRPFLGTPLGNNKEATSSSLCELPPGGLEHHEQQRRGHCGKKSSNNSKSDNSASENDDSELCMYTTRAASDSQFNTYRVLVDPAQADRAVDIPLYSAARPHMRAFHLAWSSFFCGIFHLVQLDTTSVGDWC